MDPFTDGFAELTLETPDRDALERFYVDGIGLEVLAREDDRTWLAAGPHARLGLWEPGEKEFGDEGGAHVHFAFSAAPGRLDAALRAVARARRRGPRPGGARRRRPVALRRGPGGQRRRGLGLLRARQAGRGAGGGLRRPRRYGQGVPPSKRVEVEVEGRTPLALQPAEGLLPRGRLHQGAGDRVLHADRARAAPAPARPAPDAQALSRGRRGAVLLREAVPLAPARLGADGGRVVAPQRARDRLLHGRRPRHDGLAGQPRRPRAAHAARATRSRRRSRR